MAKRTFEIVGALVLAIGMGVPAEAQTGTIHFPTSASPAVQEHFVEGVKILQSFGFEDAIEQFLEAQRLDPDFALAYWGEAMAYNGNPLSARQNISGARGALAKLAPTRAERIAKAATDREKGYMEAVELLYGRGDKGQRDQAYADQMGRLVEQYPEDDEAKAFYALALLATVGRFEEGYRIQMQAGAVAQEVFRRNSDHPGAAHYIIHAFDDETHAPLALHAARVYGRIAPDVEHALHMPAHIFVQRGLWDEVIDSNRRAYDASVAWARAKGLSDTRRDFHALSWLHYARLQQGRLAAARAALDEIRPIAERELTVQRVKATLSNMTARYILETGQWQTLPEAFQAERYGGDAYMLLAAGISAARTGHLDVAEQAAARLRELGTASADLLRSALQGQVTLEDLQRSVQIGHHEVLALIDLANGRGDQGLAHMDQAVAIEEAMHPSYGPPEPMVPPRELYGQILFELDRPDAAATKFADLLLHRPNRTQSMLGLARAAAKTGDRTMAKTQYEALTRIWAPDTELPAFQEARLFLSETDEP